VAEGPKLFKRHGYYFISLPEGGVSQGGQTVVRAKSLYGPYERREVLPAGSPHQGGLVELDNGEAWFIGFLSTGFQGRIAHLLPVKWGEDDWQYSATAANRSCSGKNLRWAAPTRLSIRNGATSSTRHH